MWDSHVKAFLLLQAYFARIDLPISDYVGDQNSVLDQSIRIAQASIDILTELGFFSSCNMMITLLQCIKSARWPEDGALAILPGIEMDMEKDRNARTRQVLQSLPPISDLSRTDFSELVETLKIPQNLHEECWKVINMLPILDVQLSNPNATGLTVNIVRLNAPRQPDYRVYAPKYPKPQSEGYFLLVVDPARDEILALKRITWPPTANVTGTSNKLSSRTPVEIDPTEFKRRVDVIVISDAYIGMRWQVPGVEIPPAPLIDQNRKLKE